MWARFLSRFSYSPPRCASQLRTGISKKELFLSQSDRQTHQNTPVLRSVLLPMAPELVVVRLFVSTKK